MKKLTLLLILLVTILVANAQTSYNNVTFQNLEFSNTSDTISININSDNLIEVIIIGTGIDIIAGKTYIRTLDNTTKLQLSGEILIVPNKQDRKQQIQIVYYGKE